MKLICRINGEKVEREVDPAARLLDTLREELRLTGTKEGCGKGECGACTIFVNGKPVDSCLMLTIQAQGAEIVTIEGLARDGVLHPVQKSFAERSALQCGFCGSGMLLTAAAFVSMALPLVVFLSLQRYFVRGILAGSIKG